MAARAGFPIEERHYGEIAEIVNRVFSDPAGDPAGPGSSRICSHELERPIPRGTEAVFRLADGAERDGMPVVYLGAAIINDERRMARGVSGPRHRINFEAGRITLIADSESDLGSAGDYLRVYARGNHRLGWGGSPCADLPDDDRRILAAHANGLIGRARIMAELAETFGGWEEWSSAESLPEFMNLGRISDFDAVMRDGVGFFERESGNSQTADEGVFAVWTDGSVQRLIAAHGGERSGGFPQRSRTRAKAASFGAGTSISAGDGGIVTITHAGHGFERGDMAEFAGLGIGSISPAKTAQKALIDVLEGRRLAVTAAGADAFRVTAAGAVDGTEIPAGELAEGSASVWSPWSWTDSASAEDLSFSGAARTRPRAVLLKGGPATPVVAPDGPPCAIVADYPASGSKIGQIALFALDGKAWTSIRRISNPDAAGSDVAAGDPIRAADFERARTAAEAALAAPFQNRAASEGPVAASSARSAKWGGMAAGSWTPITAVFESEFESYGAARRFFNRGGEIILETTADGDAPDSLARLAAANRTLRIAGWPEAPFVPEAEAGFHTLHGEPDTWTLVRKFESAEDGLCVLSQKHDARDGKFIHSARIELGLPAATEAGVSVSCRFRIPPEIRRGNLHLQGGSAPPVNLAQPLEYAAGSGTTTASVTGSVTIS